MNEKNKSKVSISEILKLSDSTGISSTAGSAQEIPLLLMDLMCS